MLDKSKEVLLLKNIRINLKTEGSHRSPTTNAIKEGLEIMKDKPSDTIIPRRKARNCKKILIKILITCCRSSFLNSNRSDELALRRRQSGGNVISDCATVSVSLLDWCIGSCSDRCKITLLITPDLSVLIYRYIS